jgi:hypothetical protein
VFHNTNKVTPTRGRSEAKSVGSAEPHTKEPGCAQGVRSELRNWQGENAAMPNIRDARILIIAATGFEQAELTVPRDELRKAGAKVEVKRSAVGT